MEDDDHNHIDLEIEIVLARLNNHIQDLDENINLERINMAKLFKKQLEPLKGLWIQLHSYTARKSLCRLVREKIYAADEWLNQSITVSELEDLDAHLGRLMENKDARFNEQQIFVASQLKELVVKLKGRLGDFKQVRHEMALYIKYWLEMTHTAEIIKKSSSSMPGEDDNHIYLEYEILVSKLERYILDLDKYVNLEDAIIARTFQKEIRLLKFHRGTIPPAQRGDIEKETRKIIDYVKQWLKKKIDSRNTKEIGDGRKGEGMSSSKSLTTRKIIYVLVVDKDYKYLIVHWLQFILFGKIMNYDMEVSGSTYGNLAVDRISKGASFDLIIMDLHRSTNGVEVLSLHIDTLESGATKALRAMGVKSRIIGVTSSISEQLQQQALEAGLDGCFEKTLKADMGVKSQIEGVTSQSDQQAFIDAGLDNYIQKP
ncbi:unnamed protein product [Dovyalis caffra]|uniref:Response regulatory domain-containing protein n=1 Tax=Dovyalis caffra TaxID=77055 RepID=A0AAV1RKA6_9ROSI|nr:unnamed protein product [Dovyalis caffra]